MTSNHSQEFSAVSAAATTGDAPLEFTKLINNKGPLTKGYSLDQDDRIVTATSAALYDGRAERVRCDCLDDFLDLRDGLKPNEAFVYGVTQAESVGVTTQKNLREYPAKHAGKIARDSASFTFQAGVPGVLMLDHDVDHLAITYDCDTLRAELLRAVPELAGAPMGWAPSASSCISNAKTGVELHLLRGQRLYIVVLDGSDIPRIGRLIYERLWIYGLGKYIVSKAGSLLDRNLFDSSAWQGERIDFAAGADCTPPLVQDISARAVWNGTAPPWDSRALLPELTAAQVTAAAENRRQAQAAVMGEATTKRTAYIESRAVARAASDGISIEEARRRVRAEVELRHLPADFVLHPKEGGTITVGEVLADPKKWNKTNFADPIEPDYRDDNRIAWLNMDNPNNVFLFSHAHGDDVRYTLGTLNHEEVANTAGEVDTLIAAAERGDMGGVFVPAALDALRAFKGQDFPGWMRARARLKKAGVGVGELDKHLRQGRGAAPAEEETTADRLIELARERCKFMHDAQREPYAVFEAAGARQVYGVLTSGFRDYLSHAYYSAHDRAPTDQALSVALATLRGQAQFDDGEPCEVFTRIAKTPGGYWLDLCNDAWECVLITATGWTVMSGEGVPLFIRSSSMWPLPMPVRGGTLDDLWPLVNIPEESRLTVLAWLLECLRPDTPHVVLELIGEQGSAKSSTQKVLRRVIDPNQADLRTAPKAVDDIWIGARNSHMVSLENLSHLTPETQNALCVLATGGAYATRTLYTNAEETILNLRKPIVVNGISVLVTAQDLLDRCVHIDLPTIQHRELSGDIEERFIKAQPQLVGALLDLFVKVLAKLPSVVIEPENRPRMADFAMLGEAVFRIHGEDDGTFLASYGAMRKDGVLRTIDASPVGAALLAYLSEGPGGFTGTLGLLLTSLAAYRPHGETYWPKAAKGLGDALRRLAPALRMIGFDCKQGKKTGGNIVWTISLTKERNGTDTARSLMPQGLKQSPASPASPNQEVPNIQKYRDFTNQGPGSTVAAGHAGHAGHGVGSRGAPKSEPPSFASQGNDADDFG